MPEALKKFLEQLDDSTAEVVWDYLDGDPDAIEEMIMTVVESHLSLQKMCTLANDKKLKEVAR